MLMIAHTPSQPLDVVSDPEMNTLTQNCNGKRTLSLDSSSQLNNTETNKRSKASEEVIVIDDGQDDNEGFVTPSPQKKPFQKASSLKGDHSGTSSGSRSRSTSPVKASKAIKKAVAALSPEQEAKQVEKEEKKRVREAKRAEKAEKDAQKEAKKQKEAQAKARSANFMNSFIRPRSTSPIKVKRKTEVARLSDFDRVFRACTFKDLAPINRFASTSSNLINSGTESNEALLQEFKARHARKRSHTGSRRRIHPPISVRESMRLITEASVMGDEKLEENGKGGLANLSDRKKVPMKLLHFASDRRPAWYGTWTRATNLVGPRNPLGQDPVALDYSYDSEAEWEDEDPNGEDVQDNDDKEEDEGERSDDDSEMDDWLVDDLEEEEEDEGTAPPDDLDVFGRDIKMEAPAPGLPTLTGKSFGVNVLQAKKKKIKPIGRRFESKLIPFSTGPHWDNVLGKTTYDGFKDYQIEFLNDAGPGLNPFTFQSAELLPPVEINVAPLRSNVKEEQATPLPISKSATTPASAGVLAKAQSFPVGHLPLLLQTIEGSQSIRPVLLEELKNKFAHLGKAVTKANIDACVNIYAEKLSKKLGNKWVIKQEFRNTAGICEK